jgi:hypothetical protein
MKHDIGACDQIVYEIGIDNRAQDKLEPGIANVMADVIVSPGRKIVQADYGISPLQKSIYEMGSDKSGSTGDESAHSADYIGPCRLSGWAARAEIPLASFRLTV